MSVQIDLLAPAVLLGESPYWDVSRQKLFYTDIFGKRVLSFDPKTNKITSALIKSESPTHTVIGVDSSSNKFVVLGGKEIILVDWDGEADVINLTGRRLGLIESDINVCLNDAKCDSYGRIWTGTLGEYDDKFNIKQNQGTIYSMSPDLIVKSHFGPISLSNGLTWNSKETILYYIDSMSHQVWAFDFNLDEGSIDNKRVVFDLKEHGIVGIPDGMTIDTDDNLWVACFGGGGVAHVDPRNGKLLQFIKMPVPQVTSVAFGGPSMDILYVTTANVPTANIVGIETQNEPNAGCLYSVKGLGVQGYPHNRFKLSDSLENSNSEN